MYKVSDEELKAAFGTAFRAAPETVYWASYWVAFWVTHWAASVASEVIGREKVKQMVLKELIRRQK